MSTRTHPITAHALLAGLCATVGVALAAPAGATPPAAAAAPPAVAALAPRPLPDAALGWSHFLQAPAHAAAVEAARAEALAARQGERGAGEWTVSASSVQRRLGLSPRDTGADWELTLERPWRRAGKREAALAVGQARTARAEAQRLAAWREHGREALQRLGAWWQADAAAQAWTRQVALLRQQAEGLQRRLQLGDAPPLEAQMAGAALAQAQAQAAATQARANLARTQLLQAYAGLPWPALDEAAAPAADGMPREDTLARLLAHDPQLALGRLEAAVARGQAGVEAAEQRPDPHVGVVVGRNAGLGGGSTEQRVGLVLSLPLGGEYRRLGAEAAAARAASAQQGALEAERQARLRAVARWSEAEALPTAATRQQEAAAALHAAAERVARGVQLGELPLSDLLAARRVAQEAALLAAQVRADALLAQWSLALESGRWWALPTADRSADLREPAR